MVNAGWPGARTQPRLRHSVQDHPVGRRSDLGLPGDRLRLLELDFRPVRVVAGRIRLMGAKPLADQSVPLLARLERRLGALELRLREVVRLNGADLLGQQRVLARELAASLGDGGAAVGDLRLGGRDLGAAAARGHVLVSRLGRERSLRVPLDREGRVAEVELRQYLSRLHAVALAREHLGDAARDPGREVHERRLDAAVQVHGGFVVFLAARRRGQDRQRDRHREEPVSAPHRDLLAGTMAPRVQTSRTVSRYSSRAIGSSSTSMTCWRKT